MSQSPAEEAEYGQAMDRRSDYRRQLEHLNQLVEDGESWSGNEPNCAFLNLGPNGSSHLPFATVSATTGIDFADDGRAYALVDWDGDGAVDLWTTNRTAPRVRFLRNSHDTGNHFLQLRLRGTRDNRDAIGARVEIVTDRGSKPLVQILRAGDGFLSQSSKQIHFGLGSSSGPQDVRILWPNGRVQVWTALEPDRCYELTQELPNARSLSLTPSSPSPPLTKTSPHPNDSRDPSEGIDHSDTMTVSIASRVLLSSRLPLPRLPLRSIEGAASDVLAESNGQPVWLVFWASWCAPCVEELKEIAEKADSLRSAGILPLAVSLDGFTQPDAEPTTVTDARRIMTHLAYPFPWNMGEEELLRRVQLAGKLSFGREIPLRLPGSLLLSSRGELAAIYRGRVSVEQVLEDATSLSCSDTELLARALPFTGRWYQGRRRSAPLTFLADLLDHQAIDDALRYLQQNRTDLANQPGYASVTGAFGTILAQNERMSDALTVYQWALDADPENVPVLNNLAWHLATHKDASFRHPARAVQLAEEAARLTGHRAPAILDTLATAYSASQQPAKAKQTLERAIQLAIEQQEDDLSERLRQKLQQLP